MAQSPIQQEQVPLSTGAAVPEAQRPGRDEFLDLVQGLDAIVWEMDARTWRFQFVSARAETILGYPVQRWIDEPTFWQDVLLHPEDRGWAVDYCATATREVRDHEFLYRARAADGRIVWLKDLVRVFPGEDGSAAVMRGIMVDVTREVQAEQDRQRVVDMIERVTDAFFALDREWRFTYVNSEAERVLQRRREEMLGNSVWDLFPDAVGSQFWTEYHRAMEEGATVEFTSFYPPLDAWIDVRAYPSQHGLSVYFRNVNEQRRLEAELERSRRQLQTVAQNATLGLFIIDENQQCTYMNPAAEALTGYTVDEVRGKPLHDYVHYLHPDGTPYPLEDCPIDRAFPQNMREQGEEVFIHKDGHFYPVAFTASPILQDGTPVGTIIEAREISEELQRRADAAARDRESALALAVGEALTESGELQASLQRCMEAVVQHLDAAFARVWTVDEHEQVLLLQASAGLYTHLDGPHGRVPVGKYKIGRIAAERQPHLTNDVIHDDRVSDKEWARREGMVAFAGYPLIVDGRLVGVMAMFSRQQVPSRTLDALGAVADGIASLVVRKRAEEQQQRLLAELALQRQRLHDVFMQAPAAISVTEGPQHITIVQNEVARKLSGRAALDRPIREVYPEPEFQPFLDLLDRVYESGEPFIGTEVPVTFAQDESGRRRDGFFNFVYQPLFDTSGSVAGILTHAVEVTEQVEARREVERRADELTRLTQALERSNAELDQFAYVASHDLKAPLRGIANLAQWIDEDSADALSDDSREHIRLLQGRVHRMEALIDGILSYSRAGRVRESVEMVSTAGLLRDIVEMLAPPPTARVEIQEGMPALQAERTPLQQVFMNLISNALKYTTAVRDDAVVRVTWREEGECVAFSVSDNGPGIAPEYHDRIWGIFQTLEARDKVEGTGIGLSVVRKMVESRGGRVALESAPGAGATFTFTWPKVTSRE